MTDPISVRTNCVSDPLVTIAIPTFNRASWLRDCILSALSQTYQNTEILVSDNASTDDTEEVLRRFTDRRLRVVKQKSNIGRLPNWNACLAEARGEYVVFVSDDDRIDSWMIERCIEVAKSEPAIPIVIGLSEFSDLDSATTWRPAHNQRLDTGVHDGVDVLEEFLKDNLPIATCGIMMRADVLREHGGFPYEFPYAADMAAYSRLLFLGRVGLVNECCGTLTVHKDSVTSGSAIHELLSDWKKFSDRIVSMSSRFVTDQEKRLRLSLEAKRFFAYHGIFFLRLHLKSGGQAEDVLRSVWRWRSDFYRYGKLSILSLIRPLAAQLLPGPVTSKVRSFNRLLRRLKSTARHSSNNANLR